MTFFKSVAVLVSGTAIGHGITALALPFVSRLYTPSDFGVLAAFSSISTIISVVACLRFELAISIADSDDEAWHLLVLSVLSTLLISSMVLVLVLIAADAINQKLNQPQLAPYLWMIVLAVLASGTYNALQMWLVREKSFGLIARSRILQSSASATMQIGAGVSVTGPLGLLLGYLFNFAMACIYILIGLRRQMSLLPIHVNIKVSKLRDTVKKYEKFPRVSTSEALLNTLSIQGPLLLISSTPGLNDAGSLLFGLAIIQAPIALVGNSIGQVFLSRAPDSLRKGVLFDFTLSTLKSLFLNGAPLILLIGVSAPSVFPIIFGDAWERAGWLVAWMTPWFLCQFLATPLSMTLHVTGSQGMAFWMQFAAFFIRFGGTWLAIQLGSPNIAEIYAISGFVSYSLLLLGIIFAAKNASNK